MLYNQPTGGAANDPYVGKNVAAGIQGSKVPPGAVEYPQREIMAIIAADPNLTPTNADLGQAQKSIAYQIAQAVAAVPAVIRDTAADTSTSAATILANATPAVSTRQPGYGYVVFPANACAGATEINVGFGLVAMTRSDASALVAGDYVKGQPLIVVDDGTNMRLVDMTPSQVASLIASDAQAPSDGSIWHLGSAAAGSASALTTTLTPAPATNASGFWFSVPITTTNALGSNGAATTIDFGFGPKPIVLNSTGAMAPAGSMQSGAGYQAVFFYDGTSARLNNPTAAPTALGRLINTQYATTSGTYGPGGVIVPSAGTQFVRVTALGGGSAGGGAPASGSGTFGLGAPGSCGAQITGTYTIAQALGGSIVVGAGGAPARGAVGGAGGTSSFTPASGTPLVAPGGIGGQIGGPSANFTEGGLGSNAPTGPANSFGAQGAPGGVSCAGGSFGFGAEGASNALGAGGFAVSPNTNGLPATGNGAGGSGSCSFNGNGSLQGGAGSPGLVRIDEYAP